jgi:isoquinoline 1-oxidoreductase beta subunit
MRFSQRGQKPKQPMTRRRFLKIAGISGAGLVVLLGGAAVIGVRALQSGDQAPPPLTNDPNTWLKIEPDGRVLLSLSKIEMGQGIYSAAAQITADELDVPFEQVALAPATTTNMPFDRLGTAGSISVMQIYGSLRQAAATARQTLIELAAQRSGQPAEQFVACQGRVVSRDDASVGFSYGELVQGRQLVRASDTAAPLKSPSEFTIMGRDVPRIDIPDKVTGKAIYGADPRPEGMLIGRIARPPVFGATIQSVDLEAARSSPGVIAALRDGEFVGVAAETMDQAGVALGALNVQWRQPQTLLQQADVEAALLEGRSPTTLKEAGDVDGALSGAERTVTAQYRTGFMAHAQIEPMVGIADVRADSATVWAPTQAPFIVRDQIAEATGLNAEQVTVIPTLIGGGFGRKSLSEAAVEAARLSKAAGRPVRVSWNRAEEFQHGYTGPITITDITAALDDQGRIAVWDQHLSSGFVLFGFFPWFLRLLFGNDFGAARGAIGPYAARHLRIAMTMKELPVCTASWRGLGLLPNVFAVEQFVDELALVAQTDPLEFRLRNLPNDEAGQRMRRVLETAAQQADWGAPLPADHGRGIACAFDADTYIAQVAEVRVDRVSGAVQPLRVTAAVDCGLAISPNNVAAQTEGGIMMGLSAALKEEVTIRDGQWSARDFASYQVFRIADAPEIAVTIIDNREAPPGGMGEPPIGPIGAAVANAIAAATGARVRTMPMTPERVLAALNTAG